MIRQYVYIAVALTVAGGLWFTFNMGYDSGRAAAVVKCREDVDALALEYDNAARVAKDEARQAQKDAVSKAREYWKKKALVRDSARVVEKEVIKYVEIESSRDNVCQLDDDFLRIWNAARKGGEPDKAG